MNKPKVIIYLTENCPFCVRAKIFFTDRGIDFEAIDLTHKPKELKELKDRTHWRTVPQIFINDTFIGGYSDLVQWNEDGRLAALLKNS